MKRYLVILSFLFAVPYVHAGFNECKSLDIVEFGLIGDGNIGTPWSEIQLIEKFGPPCQTISLGETFVARKDIQVRWFPVKPPKRNSSSIQAMAQIRLL